MSQFTLQNCPDRTKLANKAGPVFDRRKGEPCLIFAPRGKWRTRPETSSMVRRSAGDCPGSREPEPLSVKVAGQVGGGGSDPLETTRALELPPLHATGSPEAW